ncbi:P4 family phage/plasmid primase-like protein [Bradyrhizobium sp. GM24.11]
MMNLCTPAHEDHSTTEESSEPIEFLKSLQPAGPWVLTTIVPDGRGRTTTRTFSRNDERAARNFIALRNVTENVYYTVNSTKTAVNKKPSKEDMDRAEYLYVDADPNKGESSQQFKARFLSSVAQFAYQPTFVIDSGNGVQLLWRLDTPIKLASEAEIADIEARNYALAKQFGADPVTRNVDRILRPPGTTNHPNAKKRKDGRTAVRSTLIKFNDVSTPLDAFPPHPEGGSRRSPGKHRKRGREKRTTLSQRAISLLHLRGEAGYQSRSELLFAFLTCAIRGGADDPTIEEACLDAKFAGNAIHSHCQENGGADYVRRQLEQAHKTTGLSTQITEDGTALAFAERHRKSLRFDHDVGKWFAWTGTHWKQDRTQFAFAEARDLSRELSRSQPQRTINITSKANFAGNVERFARADQELAVTQEVWDRDPFLIGAPGGTVDLKTGELRESRPEDMITRITAISPAETANCPTWLRFLGETTSKDHELISFLQLICGYAMTGDTSEHVLVFIYGPGGNGKSVFLNTIGGILGDYHAAAPMETFTESHHDRHPTDLAMVRGARLVTCAETSEGHAWAETRIKQLTGGDPVTARFMRQDFFTYQPTFQLLIVGNHKPKLRNITEAMRRRLAIIPFVHSPAKPDHELEEKLRQEWPGIMRWMIEGCLAWQEEKGIKRPEIVVETTKQYFNEQDLLGQWIEERLERASGSNLATVKAYEAFAQFAAQSGERNPGDIKWFHEQMEQHGFVRGKCHGDRVYRDVRFKSDEPEII